MAVDDEEVGGRQSLCGLHWPVGFQSSMMRRWLHGSIMYRAPLSLAVMLRMAEIHSGMCTACSVLLARSYWKTCPSSSAPYI